MGIFSSLFKSYSEKQIQRIIPLVNATEALTNKFKAMSDAEMRAYTDKLKGDLANGKTLDDILPEAFALVREADDRVLGKRPFRVQIIGGILLHQGRIAEMKTGEGKTLVATLPAYLNALSGKGVHIVTVNDYLAKRDSEEMGRVYGFLGLKTGLIVPGQSSSEKKVAYNADITYGTNSEFGFDYLRDNMVLYKEEMVQRGHNFTIIDEVDSILIDEARTPLIISGHGSKSTDLYTLTNDLVKRMSYHVIKELDTKKDLDEYEYDFIVDEKARTAVLTKYGIDKVEKHFGIDNLSDPENTSIYHHVNIAIKAHGVMKNEVDYIVKDGNVLIVDTFTGRIMHGRRYSDGLHQAIEAKEGVDVKRESRTIATITYQNYFRMYKKLSGMTGTALTEQDEFKSIYALDVVEVPTNRPMIRIDHNDAIFRTINGKIDAAIEQIKVCHAKGQPVLVGTVSIEKSEQLSYYLKREGIPHTVLNAKHHEKEAEIVAQAGRLGSVTISTNMAGRGTDIMLGGNPEYMAKADMRKEGIDEGLIAMATSSALSDDEAVNEARAMYRELYAKHKAAIESEAQKVRDAGGLYILGTERHESRRIDNQLRGRSGRQGDPGESKFFISLEDDLMRLFGGSDRTDKVAELCKKLGMTESMSIDDKLLSGGIETAQKRLESNHFQSRKNVLTYDDVMNQQRNVIYQQRHEVLMNDNIQDTIVSMIRQSVEDTFDRCFGVDTPEHWKFDDFRNQYLGALTDKKNFRYTEEELRHIDKEQWKEELINRALEIYRSKDAICAAIPELGPNAMREIEKSILLKNVDMKWMDHLQTMDELKEYVGLNSYAQRDPVAMFRIEGAEIFDQMIQDIKDSTVRHILAGNISVNSTQRVEVAKPTSYGTPTGAKKQPYKKDAIKKLDRNDKCHCGSGKKYKNCCWQKDQMS